MRKNYFQLRSSFFIQVIVLQTDKNTEAPFLWKVLSNLFPKRRHLYPGETTQKKVEIFQDDSWAADPEGYPPKFQWDPRSCLKRKGNETENLCLNILRGNFQMSETLGMIY